MEEDAQGLGENVTRGGDEVGVGVEEVEKDKVRVGERLVDTVSV